MKFAVKPIVFLFIVQASIAQNICPFSLMSESSSDYLVTRLVESKVKPTTQLNVVSCLLKTGVSDHSAEYVILISSNTQLYLKETDLPLSSRDRFRAIKARFNNFRDFYVATISLTWSNYELKVQPKALYPVNNTINALLNFTLKTSATKVTVDKDVSVLNTVVFFRNSGIQFAFKEEGTEIPTPESLKEFNLKEISEFGCYLWLPIDWLNKKLGTKSFQSMYDGASLEVKNPIFSVDAHEVKLLCDFYVDNNKFSLVDTRFESKDLVTNSIRLNPYLATCNGDPVCLVRNQYLIFQASTYESVLKQYVGRRLKLFEPGLKVTIELDNYKLTPQTDGRQSFLYGSSLIFFTSIK